MAKVLSIFLISLIAVLSFSNSSEAIVRVKSYVKPKTGTYIPPHIRSNPNKSKFDNFSTKGNHNPFTGKKGTVDPFKVSLPRRLR